MGNPTSTAKTEKDQQSTDAKQDQSSADDKSKHSQQSSGAKAPAKAKAKAKAAPKKAASEKKPATNNNLSDESKKAGSRDAAAAFCGIPAQEVLDFRKDGSRYIVVTIAGKKLTESAAERKARLDAEAAAAEKAD